MTVVTACSFYGLTPILLPYNLSHQKVYEILNSTSADGLICAAGNLPLDDITNECKNLRLLAWVVEKTSRHMDWNGVPSHASSRLSVSVWHDIVEESIYSSSDLPSNDDLPTPAPVMVVGQNLQNYAHPPTITSFTHANLVSATAALISAIPSRQRLTPADLVLPASSFCYTYVLCQTLGALYTHASVAITSLAEPGVDLSLATRSIAPTVIIASAESLANLHAKANAESGGLLDKLAHYTSSTSLAAGIFPDPSSMIFRMVGPSKASPAKPGKLRLILTSERLGAGSTPLSPTMLSDLRILTRARICYALTSAGVAGAVAQTHVFDYRVGRTKSKFAHFGLPLSSVEVKLLGQSDAEVGSTEPSGEIVVKGPAVAGEGMGGKGYAEVRLGVKGRFGEDGTLALV